MESTLQNPALVAAPKAQTTAKAAFIRSLDVRHQCLFCLQMSFTAPAELRLPQVAADVHSTSVSHGYFRVLPTFVEPSCSEWR